MTDDLNKSVDAAVDDRLKLQYASVDKIVSDFQEHGNADHLAGEIITHLGYEYGNGWRDGFNQLQDACRTLAAEVVALRAHEKACIEDVCEDTDCVVSLMMSAKLRTALDETATAFVKEAERAYSVHKDLKELTQ